MKQLMITLLLIAFGINNYAQHNITKNEVPFAVVERVPVFKGCNPKLDNKSLKRCMSKKITAFLVKNFNTDLANTCNLNGRQRVNVMFKIDQDGSIIGTRARANCDLLIKEAERVVKLIPKFTSPGIKDGKPVVVPYSLPIVFEVEKPSSDREFTGHLPLYKGGDPSMNNTERRSYMEHKIRSFIYKKFNSFIASDNGLSGTLRITAKFDITATGSISNIKVTAPHYSLIQETKRIIKRIPSFDQPPLLKGKAIDMPFSIPLIINIVGPDPISHPDYVELIKRNKRLLNSTIPIIDADIPPLFYNCKNTTTKEAQLKCIKTSVKAHINNNTNRKKMTQALKRDEVHVRVLFVINTEGKVSHTTVSCKNKIIKKEVLRVLDSLPAFVSPAMLNDKPVATRYSYSFHIKK